MFRPTRIATASLSSLMLLLSPLGCADSRDTDGAEGTSAAGPVDTPDGSTSARATGEYGENDGDATSGDASAGAEETGEAEGGVRFDVGSGGDGGPGGCVQCSLELSSTASTALTMLSSDVIITADLEGQPVFALADAGAGRVVLSGDSNVVYKEGGCPLWEWLGATRDQLPRVLCVGAKWPCDGVSDAPAPQRINGLYEYPTLDYGGLTLPDRYEGDAAALRADYDVVLYMAMVDLETKTWDFDPTDADTVAAFVLNEGGGAYLVGEYFRINTPTSLGGMDMEHRAALNAWAAPFGSEFTDVNLAWGSTSATAEFDCFPPTG